MNFSLKVWEVATKQCLHTFTDHSDQVTPDSEHKRKIMMMLCPGVEREVQQGGEPGRLCERRQDPQHLLNTCLKYTMPKTF